MTHLGDRITPLVDSQLAPQAIDRAHVHIASCGACREAVELERLMKHRLATLGTPQPGDELVRRLLELAGPDGPLPPRNGHVPGTPRPRAVSGPGRAVRPAGGARPAGRPTTVVSARGPRGRRPVRLTRASRVRLAGAMVGALCLVGAGVAGGVVSGAGGAGGGVQPTVVPPVDTFVVEHSTTTTSLTFGDQSGLGSARDDR